jgi:hypothetical protein
MSATSQPRTRPRDVTRAPELLREPRKKAILSQSMVFKATC